MTAPPCQACNGDWPPSTHRIADCGLTIAFLHEDQYFPGWTVLVFKQHATELFHLPPDQRSRLLEEVTAMAEVLTLEYQAVKINYELLGNVLPHIHWHIIPRMADEPSRKEPVWRITHEPKHLGPAALRREVARIRTRLRSHAGGVFYCEPYKAVKKQ
ncbi:MAG: HIT family protein [Nitrospiraceae bacterium]